MHHREHVRKVFTEWITVPVRVSVQESGNCESNPCVRGACVESAFSFTCDCSDTGYDGDRCQGQNQIQCHPHNSNLFMFRLRRFIERSRLCGSQCRRRHDDESGEADSFPPPKKTHTHRTDLFALLWQNIFGAFCTCVCIVRAFEWDRIGSTVCDRDEDSKQLQSVCVWGGLQPCSQVLLSSRMLPNIPEPHSQRFFLALASLLFWLREREREREPCS